MANITYIRIGDEVYGLHDDNALTSSSNLDASKVVGTLPANTYTNTTYENKTAVEGGTDVSLVTTGDKYRWDQGGSEQFDIIEYGVSTYEDVEYLLRSSTKPRLILQGTQLFFITAFKIFSASQSIGCYYGNRTDDGATVNALALVNQNDGWTVKTVGYTIPTATSELQNDSDFQTATQVDSAINSKIASVYKAKGSVAFANLPALTVANEGFVYDINESFTTTNDFVEGAGKTYPAGTNVVIIDIGSGVYKYDVLAGLVDLSGKQDLLVSGTNIKAINNQSLLGSGRLKLMPDTEDVQSDQVSWYFLDSLIMGGIGLLRTEAVQGLVPDPQTTFGCDYPVQGALKSGQNIKTINNQSILGSGNISVSTVAAQIVRW